MNFKYLSIAFLFLLLFGSVNYATDYSAWGMVADFNWSSNSTGVANTSLTVVVHLPISAMNASGNMNPDCSDLRIVDNLGVDYTSNSSLENNTCQSGIGKLNIFRYTNENMTNWKVYWNNSAASSLFNSSAAFQGFGMYVEFGENAGNLFESAHGYNSTQATNSSLRLPSVNSTYGYASNLTGASYFPFLDNPNIKLQNFSRQAWVLKNSTQNANYQFDGNSNDSTARGWRTEITNWVCTSCTPIARGGVANWNDDVWSHYIMVKNNATILLYIDGVLNSTAAPLTDSEIAYGTEPLKIGKGWDSTNREFSGRVDEYGITANIIDSNYANTMRWQTSFVGAARTNIHTQTPTILNSTNGTYFTVSTDLVGWVSNKLNGLSNVSYTWWNGSTNYSSGTAINLSGNSTGISHNIANISASLLNADEVWVLQINGTNGTINVSDTNSSSITIINIAPYLTNVSFTSNGSSYQLGPVQVNFTAADLDTNNITYYVNWFRNGTNITAYAQTGTMANGSTVSLSPNTTTFNVSDNWYARVWVSDGSSTSTYNDTHNTTILDYISNISTNYTTPQYDIYMYPHYLNFTYGGASGVQVGLYINSANNTATCTGTNTLNCSVIKSPPEINVQTISDVVWQIQLNLTNGSKFLQNVSYNITVMPGGLYLCNSSLNTSAINFSTIDAVNSSAVNSTMIIQSTITKADGTTKTTTITNTNTTTYACVSPQNATFTTTTSEQYTATGYAPASLSRGFSVSNTSQNATAYMYSTAYATTTQLSVVLAPNSPVSGARIYVQKYIAPSTYTNYVDCTTQSSGVCTVYLYPNADLYYYTVSVSGTNYTFGPEALVCDAGAATCYRTFTIAPITLPYYTSGNYSGNCSYSNSTNNLVCSGFDRGAGLSTFSLQVFRFGNSTALCSQSGAAPNATLTCAVPNINATFGYTFNGLDSSGNIYPIASGQITETYSFYYRFGSSDSWLAALVLFMTCATAAYWSLWASLLLGVVGIGLAIVIGLLPLAPMTGVIVALGVMVGIIGRKLVV